MENTINVILATEAHEILLCCDADGENYCSQKFLSLVDNPSVTR